MPEICISMPGLAHSIATPILGRMSVPRGAEHDHVLPIDDMDLGDPEIRVVAYEVTYRDWVEVIYV